MEQPRVTDNRGRAEGYAYRFDFNEGQAFDGDELYFKPSSVLSVFGNEAWKKYTVLLSTLMRSEKF